MRALPQPAWLAQRASHAANSWHLTFPPSATQALDARTPATAAQPGGLSRVAAALATTVQRPRAGGRLSLASAGAGGGLLDLDGCAAAVP